MSQAILAAVSRERDELTVCQRHFIDSVETLRRERDELRDCVLATEKESATWQGHCDGLRAENARLREALVVALRQIEWADENLVRRTLRDALEGKGA